MNKAVLKKFAIESRSDLMSRMSKEIDKLYYNENFDVNKQGELYILTNDMNHTLKLTEEEYNKRELLIKRINEVSYEQVVEESAYTWFNRIIAIRYMEIHDYLPLTKDNRSIGIRVLSSKDNTPDPEILKFSILNNNELDINFNLEKYNSLTEENRYTYILSLICKKLGKVIPQVFDGITDYIDILIPDNLLSDSGFITKLIKEVPEENFNNVEVIGWLYQYYNQTEKDRVISAKKAYKKNEIPYATQLFTPDWIVKYMVENSLGRYYVEHNNGKDIINHWKYFINDNLTINNNRIDPKQITFIDPCCGSGHILVYAFEVVYQIYLNSGYNKNDIPELILTNNLYGLDIDDRAGQLAILSVLLKAREYDKSIFNKEIVRNLNIMSIQESNTIDKSSLYFLNNEELKDKLTYIINTFENAKEIGSLLLVDAYDYLSLINKIREDNNLFNSSMVDKLESLLKVAYILQKKYDVVVTNPPYMSQSYMPTHLKSYLNKFYLISKNDLCTAFMNSSLVTKLGYLGMITQQSWMFLSSFENLRKNIIENKNIVCMLQLGSHAFEEIGGEVVQTTSFIIQNKETNDKSIFFRLVNYDDAKTKERKFLEINNNNKLNDYYLKEQNEFLKIPGCPIAYWISNRYIKIFEQNERLANKANVKQGLATGDNNRFLREWYEVNINNTLLNPKSIEELKISNVKWFPYNKGGEFRKWYGNNDFVVDWKDDGKTIKNLRDFNGNLKSRPQNTNFYFNESITWSKISSSSISFRYKPFGHIFDVAGTSIFSNKENLIYLLGLCNSKVILSILNATSPTLNFEVGQISSLPIKYEKNEEIAKLVNNNISISKLDWDSFEISWDFKKHSLLEFITSLPGLHDTGVKVSPTHVKIIKNNYGEEYFIADKMPMNAKISDAYDRWKEFCDKQFNTLKHNEEELNRIFIDIYELQDELTPEEEDKDVTIRKADKLRDIKSFISYAVGCMFGRYSLDEEGLIYAGGDFDSSKYKTFKADEDNIIPITDQTYFKDDIVEKFKEFLKVTFGDQTLNENMDYIAKVLGNKIGESSEDIIRRYFVNDFFNDHVKIYQKRPIYWLLDSGKKNGFKALIYMHRYNENLIPKARLDYLHKVQSVYEKRKLELENILNEDLSLIEKKNIQKELMDLSAKLSEIKVFDEKISHIANQRINIDLDDGVKVNYEKFSDILAKIK